MMPADVIDVVELLRFNHVKLQRRLRHFPNLTQLDLTDPLQVLARLPHSTHMVAKSEAPMPSDCG